MIYLLLLRIYYPRVPIDKQKNRKQEKSMQESVFTVLMLMCLSMVGVFMAMLGGLRVSKGFDIEEASESWVNDPEQTNPAILKLQGMLLIALGCAGVLAVIYAAHTASL